VCDRLMCVIGSCVLEAHVCDRLICVRGSCVC